MIDIAGRIDYEPTASIEKKGDVTNRRRNARYAPCEPVEEKDR